MHYAGQQRASEKRTSTGWLPLMACIHRSGSIGRTDFETISRWKLNGLDRSARPSFPFTTAVIVLDVPNAPLITSWDDKILMRRVIAVFMGGLGFCVQTMEKYSGF